MGFLTPAFLAGLAALAVPVLVHLTHRPRSETVPFPSLMFLQKIPYRSVRRQSLRHWLLFAMRCLAFAILALAFARPFFGRTGQAATTLAGAKVRVVLLDRSFSMGYSGRWARALEAARRAVGEAGPQDRVALVLFDRTPESAGEPSLDRAPVLAALDAARPGFGVTRYGPALRLAQEMLDASNLPAREIVLVTDFQKAGWEGADDVPLPPSTRLTWVDVSDRTASNLAITGVEMERDYESGRERVIASARLVNKGPRPVEGAEVAFDVDGRTVRQQRARLGPNQSATVTFDPFPLPPAVARGTVRVTPDALAQDDTFHFVLAPGGDLPVLALENGPPRGRSLYLQRALAIGHRPRFRVELKDVAQLQPDDLGPGMLVVLNDAPPPKGVSAKRLREFVEAGGGLLVVLADQSAPAAWPPETAALLPGPFGAPVDRSADWGATLAYVDYGHPVFDLFRGPHSGDFSSARFFRYRKLDAKDGVLSRFDDGAVALAAKPIGEGRVLVWTSSIDTAWNDLALQPVFLPFLHQLARYSASHTESPASHTVGEALDLSREAALQKDGATTLAPSGERSRLPAGSKGLELTEPGFYEVRASAGGPALQVAAVNVDRAESDLAAMDPEELAGAVTHQGRGASATRAEPALTTDEQESRQALWQYLLMAAFLLLATETVLSNRLSRAGMRPSPLGAGTRTHS
jgi:aerotolerance regulator-like protein/VWA domain-containing protein